MNLFAIWILAGYEARLLWRSWALRLALLLPAFVLTVLNIGLATEVGRGPYHFRAFSGALPLMNIKLLNVVLGAIAAFLGTEYIKRDRQLDSSQTVFVRSFSNADYTLGKIAGALVMFLGLHAAVLLLVGINHRFFSPTVFAWKPYGLYTAAITLPTLVFSAGLAGLVIALIRHQAVAFVLVLALQALSLILAGGRLFHTLDIFAFHIPLAYSDFIGLGAAGPWLRLRAAHLLAGMLCVGLTSLLSHRLRQSRLATALTVLVVAGSGAAAAWGLYWHVVQQQSAGRTRAEWRDRMQTAAAWPAPAVRSCSLDVEHERRQLQITADLVVEAPPGIPLDTLTFTLNPGLKVQNITVDGGPAAYRRDGPLLRIAAQPPLAGRDSCRVRLDYAGCLDGRFAYLDIPPEQYRQTRWLWIYSLPREYAVVDGTLLHLTPEVAWYPMAGVPPGAAFPAAGHRDYMRYSAAVTTPLGWTAFSQGHCSVDTLTCRLRHRFVSEKPVPQLSLTAGPYACRSVTVDSVIYRLGYLPGHAFFDAYLDSLAPALPATIRELRTDYESRLGLEYPYARLTLVEVPIHIQTFPRLWTRAHESVQPELVYLHEMGTLCIGADFQRVRRRARWSQERANQVEQASELQAAYFKRFARIELLGTEDPGFREQQGLTGIGTRYQILPNFVGFITHVGSARWPVLGYAFESYFAERVAPPENIWARRWTGLTESEHAALLLRDHSLSEILADAELDPERCQAVVRAKGRQLLMAMAAVAGPDRFGAALFQLLRRHRYAAIPEDDWLELLERLSGRRAAEMVDSWYNDAELFGCKVGETEAYLVRDGERTRTQVKLELANPTPVDGLVKLNLRFRLARTRARWTRGSEPAEYEQLIPLRAGTLARVGVVVDPQVAELIVDTFVSRNLPALIQVPLGEQRLRRDVTPIAGVQVDTLPDNVTTVPTEYIIDNEDSGFQTLETAEPNLLRRVLTRYLDLDEGRDEYVPLRVHDAPGAWRTTTDPRLYGEFVRSAAFKKSGDGRARAVWITHIDSPGMYDLFYHCGVLESLRQFRWRRHRRGGEYRFRVTHAAGTDAVQLPGTDAREDWNYLGTFRLQADTARVELLDEGPRAAVIADAVKWVRSD